MVDAVHSGLIDERDFNTLVDACAFSEKVYFLAETLPTHVIERQKEKDNLVYFCEFNNDLPFTAYTFGRIFSEEAELRWHKDEQNRLQVVYIGEASKNIMQLRQTHLLATSKAELASSALSYDYDYKNFIYEKEVRTYYLFGTYLQKDSLKLIGEQKARTGDFAELRIPHVLHYPATVNKEIPKRRIYLQVYEYRSTTTGQCEFFRFQTLKADLDKPNKEMNKAGGTIQQ